MASDLNFVKFVVDQLESVADISFRKMFGEFALYCNDKIVALICDNQLYIKSTEAGRTFIGKVNETSPYPGAKPAFLLNEQIENKDWLSHLIIITEKELPKPKPKKQKKKQTTAKT